MITHEMAQKAFKEYASSVGCTFCQGHEDLKALEILELYFSQEGAEVKINDNLTIRVRK